MDPFIAKLAFVAAYLVPIFVIAQAMILPNRVAGLSGLVPFALLYACRVGKEERMMEERFGEVYVAYKNCTGRLLPRG